LRTTLKRAFFAILIPVSLFVSGCGVYTGSTGRVDESLKRVAVRTIDNRTTEPNLGVDLSDSIIEAIQTDNSLKVVDEQSADSIIYGEIVRYNLREVATRADLTVNEYQVQIAVVLTFEIVDSGEKIFAKKRFNGTGNYVLDESSETNEASARAEAADEIVKDILGQVVEDW
jgi:lipopolysaccharide assembly LptE-like protein